MKDKVLEILKQSDKAIDVFEIQNLLKLSSTEEFTMLLKILHELEEDVIIYHSNKDKYMLLENSHLRKGVMRANKKGFGFVEIDNMEDDIYVSQDNMNGAIHDDIVLVEITSKIHLDRLEGRVLKIIKRQVDQYIGEINFDSKGRGHLKLDDSKIKLNIEISKENSMGAVDGHKVIVELIKKMSNTRYSGKVVNIIGHKNDPGVDILSVIHKYKIDTEFSKEIAEELKKLPNSVSNDEMEGRKDLRDDLIFTIDGDDTKDIDDAISINQLDNGNYILGVHIADVSYYVPEASFLDNDAMERGTSVYLVDRVVPMLPHQLSNGICSLNEGEDRLAISCVMEFNNVGKMIDYEIFPSVINSKKKMTYNNVNKFLEENIIVEGYEKFVDSLSKMADLAKILRDAKNRRGYIDFGVDEAKILVDENCKPVDIVLRERGTGENIIEDFMIAANECVASHIYYMNLPFVYRIHEIPSEEKIKSFLNFVSSLGYSVKGNVKDIRPLTMQKILNSLRDKPEFKILSTLLLRSMRKAIYSPKNAGHYGLASPCYTHFTAPIRRYPDLTVHRLLRTYLFEGKANNENCRKWEEKLAYITEHSSLKERTSIDCEREVEDMKMAEYMENHIGEIFDGMISSVTNFGMFVELDNLIEGLVPLRDMPDFFVYDEEKMTLTGERSHVKYSIGDKIRVRCVRASKEERIIDFEIVKKEQNESSKKGKKK